MENEISKGNKAIKDRVNDITTINFSVTKCPLKVYREFVAFCKEETSDNYSFGLKLLLDGMKGNIREATLFQQYLEMKERLDKLEEKDGEKPPFKTMGSA